MPVPAIPVPATPGPGLVVVEADFGLGRLESIRDRPTLALERHQGWYSGPGWAPSRKKARAPSERRRRISRSRAHGPESASS
jgi:hypothetical protein